MLAGLSLEAGWLSIYTWYRSPAQLAILIQEAEREERWLYPEPTENGYTRIICKITAKSHFAMFIARKFTWSVQELYHPLRMSVVNVQDEATRSSFDWFKLLMWEAQGTVFNYPSPITTNEPMYTMVLMTRLPGCTVMYSQRGFIGDFSVRAISGIREAAMTLMIWCPDTVTLTINPHLAGGDADERYAWIPGNGNGLIIGMLCVPRSRLPALSFRLDRGLIEGTAIDSTEPSPIQLQDLTNVYPTHDVFGQPRDSKVVMRELIEHCNTVNQYLYPHRPDVHPFFTAL